MPVLLEFKSKRSGNYESRVRGILQEACREEPPESMFYIPKSACTVKSIFDVQLDEIPQLSGYCAKYLYKSVLSDNGLELTIHHLDSQGDPDRVIAVITTIRELSKSTIA